MIPGDIETTEKVEYEDLLNNYYEKMEIIEEQDKEIERLHSIIKEVRHYIKDTKQDGYKLVWIDKDNNYFESGIEEILDKENKDD